MEVINEKQRKFAINFVMYFFCFIFVCIVGISNVFGLDYTNIGDKADITLVLVSTDYSGAPFTVPKDSAYNFTQVLEIDYLVSNYNFEANKNYQLESHLTQQQLTNANYYSVQGYDGEQCLISYDNSIFTGAYPRWAFQCPHATDHITLTIKNSENQYLWASGQTNIFTWTTALLKYSNTSLSSGNDNTDTIINNNNQNTQNIINNNNQNTQDIIDNNNQNTQNIIDSNRVCTKYDVSSGIGNGFLQSDGTVGSVTTSVVTDFLPITSNDKLKNLVESSSDSLYRVCFYNVNKSFLSCVTRTDYNGNNDISIPNDTSYVRFTINKSLNKPQFEICKNGNQALNDSINNLDDTLKDDNTTDAENEASEFFNSFTTDTFGLTSIITAPLNLIRSVLSSTCTDLQLPLPYLDNKKLTLPCMSTIYSQFFGSFFTIYQTISYGIIAYWVCVRIFNQVKDFKNPEHDEIEVMDL